MEGDTMKDDLKTKLQNLSGKFSVDVDVISLKALCSVPESEETLVAITEILNRLVEKYPDDEEILGLIPKKERPSLEDTIKVLEERYPGNVEVITLKALTTLPEGKDKENAVNKCMERLLEANEDDQDIMDYLGMEEKKYKEKLKDMVLVKGGLYPHQGEDYDKDGKYNPSTEIESIPIADLYVGKYQVTQDEWKSIMGTDPSSFKGSRRPVESITWIEALEFCNKLSEKYGLQPVYKIENGQLTRIIHKNGEEVYPDQADFKKTEGYRLPTYYEWEWFARGGEKTVQDYSLFYRYIDSTSEQYMYIAWCNKNSGNQTHAVGTKIANALGLYDCYGNVCEWVYDTYDEFYWKEYQYDESCTSRQILGGSFKYGSGSHNLNSKESDIGFRIVRTA